MYGFRSKAENFTHLTSLVNLKYFKKLVILWFIY